MKEELLLKVGSFFWKLITSWKWNDFFWKIFQTSLLNLSSHIEDYIIYNYVQKELIKKTKIQDFIGKMNFQFFNFSIF